MAVYLTSLFMESAPGGGSILGQGYNGIYVRDKILNNQTSLTYTSTDNRFTPIVNDSYPRFFKVLRGIEGDYVAIACNVVRTDRPGSPVQPHWTICSMTKPNANQAEARNLTPIFITVSNVGASPFNGPSNGLAWAYVTNPFPATIAPNYLFNAISNMIFVQNSAVDTGLTDRATAAGRLNLFDFTP